ncbi:MAG: winged helix-turn-helix domain-containing protein [Chloroflexota bacterium]
MTSIHWVSGTAGDFFLSLFVLHHAADFGVRPAWAAGVRQRVSSPNRETLERIFSFSGVPLEWISRLPAPRDALTALRAAADLAPADRLPALTLPSELPDEARRLLKTVADRGMWTPEDKLKIISLHGHGPGPSPAGFDNLLMAWTALADNGEKYLAALQEYYQVYFAEEEARIRPALESGLAKAQSMAPALQPGELVERLSRGVRLEGLETLTDLTLLPTWWVAPLVFLARPGHEKMLMAFGVRPEVQSGAVGAEAPETLVIALKSLGDPTRLRILRYLSDGPLSPSELARRLRLRPPTIIHHLRVLRFAGLVQVTVSESMEKRYAARLEALQAIQNSLQEFLNIHV